MDWEDAVNDDMIRMITSVNYATEKCNAVSGRDRMLMDVAGSGWMWMLFALGSI